MHYRDTIMEVNVNNIFHNISTIKRLNKGKKIKAIVKANAYGHGLISFSKILEKYNLVDSFGVSNLDEGMALRKNGIKLPIMILGAVNFHHFQTALDNNISITCLNSNFANSISRFGKGLEVHIKIDTGMNRIGFKTLEEFQDAYNMIINGGGKVVGLYSHLASADEEKEYTYIQIEKFKKFVNSIENLPSDTEIHLQNSAGAINYNDLDFVNTIRPGIGMYGVNITDKECDLKELITLKSMVITDKYVDKGETIGYNRTYTTESCIRIGTIPLGYADGYKLCYGNLFAYKDDRIFPIRGKICMDQLMIEIDNIIKSGDFVTFIGEKNTVLNISKKTMVSPYEVLTSLSARIHKQYILDGKIILEENQIL